MRIILNRVEIRILAGEAVRGPFVGHAQGLEQQVEVFCPAFVWLRGVPVREAKQARGAKDE